MSLATHSLVSSEQVAPVSVFFFFLALKHSVGADIIDKAMSRKTYIVIPVLRFEIGIGTDTYLPTPLHE